MCLGWVRLLDLGFFHVQRSRLKGRKGDSLSFVYFFKRLVITLGICLAVACSAFGFAQSELENMRASLQDGYYAYATRFLGPSLVASLPDNPEAHYLFAYALYLTGNIEQSRAELDEAYRLLGQTAASAEFAHLSGLLYAAENDFSNAQDLLKQAFSVTKSYEIAMDLGRVSWQSGDFSTALQAYEEATLTEQGQREPWPYLDKGRILVFQGEYEEAIKAFNTAIEVFEANDTDANNPASPAAVEAFFRLGEVHELLGNFNEAEINYKNARTTDPNYTPAISALDRLARRIDSP